MVSSWTTTTDCDTESLLLLSQRRLMAVGVVHGVSPKRVAAGMPLILLWIVCGVTLSTCSAPDLCDLLRFSTNTTIVWSLENATHLVGCTVDRSTGRNASTPPALLVLQPFVASPSEIASVVFNISRSRLSGIAIAMFHNQTNSSSLRGTVEVSHSSLSCSGPPTSSLVVPTSLTLFCLSFISSVPLVNLTVLSVNSTVDARTTNIVPFATSVLSFHALPSSSFNAAGGGHALSNGLSVELQQSRLIGVSTTVESRMLTVMASSSSDTGIVTDMSILVADSTIVAWSLVTLSVETAVNCSVLTFARGISLDGVRIRFQNVTVSRPGRFFDADSVLNGQATFLDVSIVPPASELGLSDVAKVGVLFGSPTMNLLNATSLLVTRFALRGVISINSFLVFATVEGNSSVIVQNVSATCDGLGSSVAAMSFLRGLRTSSVLLQGSCSLQAPRLFVVANMAASSIAIMSNVSLSVGSASGLDFGAVVGFVFVFDGDYVNASSGSGFGSVSMVDSFVRVESSQTISFMTFEDRVSAATAPPSQHFMLRSNVSVVRSRWGLYIPSAFVSIDVLRYNVSLVDATFLLCDSDVELLAPFITLASFGSLVDPRHRLTSSNWTWVNNRLLLTASRSTLSLMKIVAFDVEAVAVLFFRTNLSLVADRFVLGDVWSSRNAMDVTLQIVATNLTLAATYGSSLLTVQGGDAAELDGTSILVQGSIVTLHVFYAIDFMHVNGSQRQAVTQLKVSESVVSVRTTASSKLLCIAAGAWLQRSSILVFSSQITVAPQSVAIGYPAIALAVYPYTVSSASRTVDSFTWDLTNSDVYLTTGSSNSGTWFLLGHQSPNVSLTAITTHIYRSNFTVMVGAASLWKFASSRLNGMIINATDFNFTISCQYGLNIIEAASLRDARLSFSHVTARMDVVSGCSLYVINVSECRQCQFSLTQESRVEVTGQPTSIQVAHRMDIACVVSWLIRASSLSFTTPQNAKQTLTDLWTFDGATAVTGLQFVFEDSDLIVPSGFRTTVLFVASSCLNSSIVVLRSSITVSASTLSSLITINGAMTGTVLQIFDSELRSQLLTPVDYSNMTSVGLFGRGGANGSSWAASCTSQSMVAASNSSVSIVRSNVSMVNNGNLSRFPFAFLWDRASVPLTRVVVCGSQFQRSGISLVNFTRVTATSACLGGSASDETGMELRCLPLNDPFCPSTPIVTFLTHTTSSTGTSTPTATPTATVTLTSLTLPASPGTSPVPTASTNVMTSSSGEPSSFVTAMPNSNHTTDAGRNTTATTTTTTLSATSARRNRTYVLAPAVMATDFSAVVVVSVAAFTVSPPGAVMGVQRAMAVINVLLCPNSPDEAPSYAQAPLFTNWIWGGDPDAYLSAGSANAEVPLARNKNGTEFVPDSEAVQTTTLKLSTLALAAQMHVLAAVENGVVLFTISSLLFGGAFAAWYAFRGGMTARAEADDDPAVSGAASFTSLLQQRLMSAPMSVRLRYVLRFPTCLIVPAVVLLPRALESCTAAVAADASSSSSWTVLCLVCLALAMVTFTCCYYTTGDRFRAQLVPRLADPLSKIPMRLQRWWTGEREWIPVLHNAPAASNPQAATASHRQGRLSLYHYRYKTLYDEYVPGRQWYFATEIAFVTLMTPLGAVRSTSNAVCSTMLALVLVLALGNAVVLAAFRPFRASATFGVNVLCCFLTLVAAGLALSRSTQFYSSGVATAAAFIGVARAIMDGVLALIETIESAKRRQEQNGRGAVTAWGTEQTASLITEQELIATDASAVAPADVNSSPPSCDPLFVPTACADDRQAAIDRRRLLSIMISDDLRESASTMPTRPEISQLDI